ncbi:PGF-CTERM-anchored ABC transporter substrate-binding protein [Halomarina litorea]|uniref:PGF-CTERM-anchored ABC transporter substrate-binding protein n=1 Tax=Halomarina litorea TaxID=2961595 RepID=UPI0020C4446A|nr:PGF-CTERM-anchored ABC transporter substrate-binding protein [Halomarina sp. BCD28]
MRYTAILAALALVLAVVPAAVTGVAAAPGVQQENCSFPFSGTDATGTEVTVEDRPERIVALQASTAQILWEVNAQERVVGMPVRSYTAYLNGSESRTDVLTGDGTSVNVEQVVALEPDVVVAPSSIPNATVSQLRDAGVTVYKFSFDRSIEGIYEKTTLLGRLVGNCEEANATVEEMRSSVERIERAVEGRERPDALYYFYNFTAGNGTFIHEVITTAGGDNVAANAGISGFGQISDEVVAERNPDWILHPSDAPLPQREPFASTTAYAQNQTLSVNANYMNQPAPRVVIPMLEIAQALHPEAFEGGANGTTANETATDEPTTNATDNATAADPGDPPGETPTSSGDGPGFGVVATLVALLATMLLVRRS